MRKDHWQIETKAVQSGYKPSNTDPRIPPIVQSTTYKYDSAEEVSKIFDLEKEGHIYSRISNPTVDCFEKKIASLEGGVGALATSSGQSAVMIAVLNICSSGDHILASKTIYGGSVNLFENTLKKFGIQVTFFSQDMDEENILKEALPETKLIYAETIGNPSLKVLDFEKFSKIAEKLEIPFFVDNTFASPYLCRPIEHGAHIVIHSATKYIDGHASSVGGVIIDSGRFNWENPKFPELNQEDPSYHGVVYSRSFGNKAYIIKARTQLLRDLGACLSPFNAFLMNMNLETLHLRMKQHSENALKLAEFLQNHPSVNWVTYPLLQSNPDYQLALKYLPNGGSGVISFGIKGGKEAGNRFLSQVKLATLVIHVCDNRTHVLHPASTTHRQLTKKQQEVGGITPDMIRLSVGIENIEDIIEDIDQALNQSV